MHDWHRLVRAHLPPLPLRPEREAEIGQELAQLLEDAYAESARVGESPSKAELADWVATQIPGWMDLASEIRRVEKPLQSRLPIPQHPPAQRREPSGKRRTMVMNSLFNDVRYALRMLSKNPGFTVLAAVTLALGIGINSAVFSVVNALLLRPLPVEAPHELVSIYSTHPGNSGMMSHEPMAFPDYRDLAEQSDGLKDLLAYCFSLLVLDDGDEHHFLYSELVTGNYFEALGVPVPRGRALTPDDDRPGAARAVTVLSHRTWRRRFGGDPAVLGRILHINGQPLTVVGIAGERYPGLMPGVAVEAWIPLGMSQALAAGGSTTSGYPTPGLDRFDDRNRRWLWVLGRLGPGVAFEQAQSEVEVRAVQLQKEYPNTNEGRGFAVFHTQDTVLVPFFDSVISGASAVLMALVGLVLLIVCANLANMLLARALFRRKEMATRLALGASRWQVLRQLLTESVALALIGGVLGLLVAMAAHQVLGNIQVTSFFQVDLGLELDFRVLAFTFAVATFTGLVFGLTPALAAMDGNLAWALHEEGRGMAGGRARRRLRGALVVAQVALALLLLICAGLSLRSMDNARRIDPGFDSEGVVAANLMTPAEGLTEAQILDFYRQLKIRVQAMGAVRAVTYASKTPLNVIEFSTLNLAPEGGAELDEDDWPLADTTAVGPDYFNALGITLLSGQPFSEHQTRETPRVAIVNETLAESFWPGEPAVGQGLEVSGVDGRVEVVGVAKDSKYRTLGEAPRPFIYFAIEQSFPGDRNLLVRADGSLQATLAQVRQLSRDLDRRMAILNLRTLDQAIAPSVMLPRVSAVLFGAFGLTGLLLAAIGIYGVIAYMAGQRTHEIGIRMAMGAARGDILRLIVRDGVTLTLIGVAVGLAGAVFVTRLLSSILYGVSATDVVTFVGVSLFLGLVALMASYIPARRAAKVDPLTALRYE